jgi:hypothetical protein
MSRSRRKKKPQRPKIHVPASFAVDDAVRVRPGVADPDFAGFPLGGWSGTVAAVDRKAAPRRFLVEWNQRTLEQMSPIYRTRCARDGLSVRDMWLDEASLQCDTGEFVAIEQPTEIVTRPLLPNLAEDRIRVIFGLTGDEPVPPVNAVTLRQYHRYLAAHLAFPFVAEFTEAIGDPDEVTGYHVQVVALLGPDEADGDDGLICQVVKGDEEADVPLALLRVKGSSRNRELVADYSFWFFEESMECADAGAEDWQSRTPGTRPLSTLRAYFRLLRMVGVVGIVYGLILGIILGAAEAAASAATLGAALLAFVGGVAGCKIGLVRDRQNGTRLGPVQGSLFLALLGGVVGALAGATAALLIAAYPGALVGGLLAALIAGLRARADTAMERSLLGAAVGAVIGALALAVWRDYEQAWVGALYGAGGGAVAALLVVLAFDGYCRWSLWRNRANPS